MNDHTRYQRGLTKLAEVDGDAGRKVLEPLGDLGRHVIEFAFGDIYSREGISLREREMVTVAVLTVTGRDPQLKFHLNAALNVGLTFKEIEETIIQTVPYAGFPTAINALNLLKQVAMERETN